MFVQLNCIIVDPNAENRAELGAFLARSGVNVVHATNSFAQLAPLLAQSAHVRLVIATVDPAPAEALAAIGPLIRQFPATSFFVMSRVIDAGIVMEAMHQGVKDFIPLPIDSAKFLASLDRITQADMGEARAKVINVVPSVGGCGATTIACNVAASLARESRALLVDLDLFRGAVSNAFDLRPRYSVADVMDLSTDLDRALIDNAITMHKPSGLAVLCRPESPEDSQRVTRQGLTRLLNATSRMFDYILIDSIMSLEPMYTSAIQHADLNLIVMQLNVPSAKNTERFLGALRRMGVDSSRTQVIVNRAARKAWDIDPADVEKALGLKISWTIPNDYKNAIAAVNYGEPIVLRVPRAEISESIGGLARMLNGKAAK